MTGALNNKNIARAVYETLKGKSDSERVFIYPKVVEFLNRKRLMSQAGDILERLEKIINTEEGRLEARVYTVKNLGDDIKRKLAEAISKKYGGKDILIKEHLDEKILGGYRIEIGDEVIDLSLKSKIKKLQEHLTHSI
jgi:F-type H+-transporting ATPase subunit delta